MYFGVFSVLNQTQVRFLTRVFSHQTPASLHACAVDYYVNSHGRPKKIQIARYLRSQLTRLTPSSSRQV